jgi:two-component system chemotaxis sensor kinase CheA
VARDPYQYFRIEARELLEQLSKGALDLEKAPSAGDASAALLRLAHTLKGAARVVKQGQIAEQAHAIEDLLEPLRDSVEPAARDRVDAVLKRLDTIGERLAALSPPSSAAATVSSPSPDDASRTVRADVAEVDALLGGVAEARAQLTGLKQSMGKLDDIRRLLNTLVEPGAVRTPLATELRATLSGFEQSVASCLDRMDRDLQLTRHTAERLRLTRSGVLFDVLERTARDTAQALGKQILFEGRGGEVRLDAHVLGMVQGALVQLVRNAAAHGIEPEARRSVAGKPPAGRIVLEVARRGRRIAFSCSDDGAGVDVEAVRLTALRKGLAGPAVGGLGAEDILRLLLGGGISTSGTVTEVSGRGIGLDIVREAGERLGGEVVVRTQAGVGTTVELLIPISVASLEVLLIGTPDGVMSIPLDAVRRVQHLKADDIASTALDQTAACDGETLPFAPLSALIGARSLPRRGGAWTAVMVAGANGGAAIGVDRLLGSASVVLRPLPRLAPPVPIVAGTSSDADGAPQLVLDPDGLVAAARHLAASQDEAEETPRSLLVIDDSLTTRMLEKSILESAGYRVNTARSAEEGLDEAKRERYALFLVDVEMPGMDGFTFIEHIRRDPELRDIPALLVTSRGSPDSRRRGRDVGAQGYIVKSEFDQGAFLQAVGQLVN